MQVIPADFLVNREFHKYTQVLMKHMDVEYLMRMQLEYHAENPERINHITVLGPWRQFAAQVDFGYHKMIRFRFMCMIEDLDGPGNEPTRYPVFHLC